MNKRFDFKLGKLVGLIKNVSSIPPNYQSIGEKSQQFEPRYKSLVFRHDYGSRDSLKHALLKILQKHGGDVVRGATLLINNNIFDLDLYVFFGLDVTNESIVSDVKGTLAQAGSVYRPDLTSQYLCDQMKLGRFNLFTLDIPIMLEFIFSHGFHFRTKSDVAKSISMSPLRDDGGVFISHSSLDKKFIRELLPHLTAAALPVWFDEVNIDVGDHIANEVESGIYDARAVIFFVTKNFLASKWCKSELDSFKARLRSKGDVKIISIIDSDVSADSLPPTFTERLYLKRDVNETVEQTARRVVPALWRHLEQKAEA